MSNGICVSSSNVGFHCFTLYPCAKTKPPEDDAFNQVSLRHFVFVYLFLVFFVFVNRLQMWDFTVSLHEFKWNSEILHHSRVHLYLCISVSSENVGFHRFTYTHVQEENHPRMMHVTKLVASLRHSGVEWFQKVLDLRKFHIVVSNNFRWFVAGITYFDMSYLRLNIAFKFVVVN